MELLAEIRAAFPATAYPGDAVLSDCWCEECKGKYRNLRGKSWKQLRLDDFNSEEIPLSDDAFRYYLPGLLCLAVQHPDEDNLGATIHSRFIVSDLDSPEKVREVLAMVSHFSLRQRRALELFFQWLGSSKCYCSLTVDAALVAVRDNRVEPYSHEALMTWCRVRTAN